MNLKIIKQEDNIYFVNFAKQQLEISENSENWNYEGINQFLIQLATKTPDDEEISVSFDEELIKNDKVYKHIVDLFSDFSKKVNELNKNK